ncbi:uncharacterized protein [Gorilla gorilla gorilla]|uniref:uncharacterized protein n=1 Tax=Gorilla gorilla gorilla TaxID=9595 RepID=UPI002445FD65|nr:uncharacterized protein LOC109029131 [Gorilla gorilla gorilla]
MGLPCCETLPRDCHQSHRKLSHLSSDTVACARLQALGKPSTSEYEWHLFFRGGKGDPDVYQNGLIFHGGGTSGERKVNYQNIHGFDIIDEGEKLLVSLQK